jgi:rubredoxin
MNDAPFEYFKRHPKAAGVMFVGLVVSTLVLPRWAMPWIIGTYLVAFGTHYAWTSTTLPKGTQTALGATFTIGDHLRRTRALYMRILLPIIIAWVAVTTFYPPTLTKDQRMLVGVAGGTLIAFLGFVMIKDKFKCPRCGSNFRKERIEKLGRFSTDKRGAEDLWDACPSCGVSFKEPYNR